MKKSIEFYNNLIKENNETITTLTEKIETINSNLSFEKLMQLRRVARETGNDNDLIKYQNERELIIKETALLSDQVYKLKVENRLLKHNIKVCFINKSLPVVIDILNKYAGKKYGEKTKQKINDEIKNAINCYAYFGNYDYLNIVNCNNIGISENDYKCFLKYDSENKNARYFLIDNTIQNIEIDNISIYGMRENTTIIENVRKYADQVINQRKQIAKLSKDLQTAINNYNNIKTAFLPEINYISAIDSDVLRG